MNTTKITEEINSNSIDIDKKSIIEILTIFNSEDTEVIKSINKATKKNGFKYSELRKKAI